MMPLLAAVSIASLLGSLHCAGMCGPFAALAVMPGRGAPGRRCGPPGAHLAYHAGRLAVYAVLGAAAGTVGAALDLGGSLVGIGRAAAIGAGAFLVILGSSALLRILGVRLPPPPFPAALGRWIGAAQARAAGWPPPARALAVGLLTALLPCGWLYAFVVVAAGTGSPLAGVLVLAAFWAGTVPVLAGIGAGAGGLLRRGGRALQLAGAALIIGLGLASISGRWSLPAAPGAARRPPATVDEALRRVEEIRGEEPSCCKHD